MKQKVIIADIKSVNNIGKSEGHYFPVARNYLEMLHDDFDIKVAGGPVYRNEFSPNELFELPYDNTGSNRLLNLVRTLINGFYLIKNRGDATIVFQCSAVSSVLLVLSLINTKAKIFLIQYDKMIQNSKVKSLLFKIAKSKIRGVICPGDEIGKSLEVPYCVVPDYIYVPKLMPKCIDYKEKKYDFGMYGILANGKGICEAAEYLSKTQYKVKIAGKVASLPEDIEMHEKLLQLAEKNGNIDLEIGYLADNVYREYMATSRYIILNYSSSYALRSSGVILDAIYSRTPVIVKDRAYVQFVKEHGIGCVYSELTELKLDELLNAERYEQYQDAIERYLETQKNELERMIGFIRG